MGLDEMVREIKNRPGFTENVGMIMLHNGVVRGWSRDGHRKVTGMRITPDEMKIGAICQELGSRPGIFAISAQANAGFFKPGDDVLYLAVAGDVRENVISVFEELLRRVKKDGVKKEEIFE